jgi:hypothetical protein
MEHDNLGGIATEGVSASPAEAQESSPDSTIQQVAQDPTKNLKSEMNRKFSKLEQKIEQLLQQSVQTRSVSPVEETDNFSAPDYKRYVDARFQEAQKAEVVTSQEKAWQQALELFPELNPDSDQHDEKFYKLADSIYREFDLTRSKNAPLLAAKQAALELGKIEQLAKEKLLKDEARRSRLISEGAAPSRESKKEREPQLNERNLARLGVDAKKLRDRIKANKDKYGEE